MLTYFQSTDLLKLNNNLMVVTENHLKHLPWAWNLVIFWFYTLLRFERNHPEWIPLISHEFFMWRQLIQWDMITSFPLVLIQVRSGTNVLVCGPNGCGKSSLFRVLGEVRVNYSQMVCMVSESSVQVKTTTMEACFSSFSVHLCEKHPIMLIRLC